MGNNITLASSVCLNGLHFFMDTTNKKKKKTYFLLPVAFANVKKLAYYNFLAITDLLYCPFTFKMDAPNIFLFCKLYLYV